MGTGWQALRWIPEPLGPVVLQALSQDLSACELLNLEEDLKAMAAQSFPQVVKASPQGVSRPLKRFCHVAKRDFGGFRGRLEAFGAVRTP